MGGRSLECYYAVASRRKTHHFTWCLKALPGEDDSLEPRGPQSRQPSTLTHLSWPRDLRRPAQHQEPHMPLAEANPCLFPCGCPHPGLDHLSITGITHPSTRPLDIRLPSRPERNKLARAHGVARCKQGKLLFLFPAAVAGVPIKPCLYFLSGL